jgi:2-dehydro-3-deoxyphosphogluconate aldolase / (4S)-4-hydroxy-2-oxoglutarate aldolase
MHEKTLPKPLTALSVMQDAPVIPVIVIDQVEHAVPLARALVAGGIRMLEVTLRTPVALQAMERIANEVPEAVLGAGTIRSVADMEAVAKVGAQFCVSPGYTKALGMAANAMGMPLLPGVATGSEIMQAQEDGFTQLKFFPALQAGGIAMLKAWAGPFYDVRFCPTGGITPDLAPQFLALPNVVCVGGSWLSPKASIEAGDWPTVTELAKAAAATTRYARVAVTI